MSKYLELPWGVEDTIENMRKLKEVLQKMCITDNLDGRGEKDAEEIAFDFDRAINALEEIQKYRAIGTPEECRAAVEKQKAKKPIMKPYFKDFEEEYLCCPTCGEILTDRIPFKNDNFYFYCLNCGQKFDWGDEE